MAIIREYIPGGIPGNCKPPVRLPVEIFDWEVELWLSLSLQTLIKYFSTNNFGQFAHGTKCRLRTSTNPHRCGPNDCVRYCMGSRCKFWSPPAYSGQEWSQIKVRFSICAIILINTLWPLETFLIELVRLGSRQSKFRNEKYETTNPILKSWWWKQTTTRRLSWTISESLYVRIRFLCYCVSRDSRRLFTKLQIAVRSPHYLPQQMNT